MFERYSPPLDTEFEDDGGDIAFGSAEWHRRSIIIGSKLTELAAALPVEIRERPLAEIVAEDRAPGVGVRTYEEILALMEAAETIDAVEETVADSDMRELVA
jgi:hypothetical protein